ncbi:MAG: nucleotidyltransferase family protein [Pseudomonadota bacterium]
MAEQSRLAIALLAAGQSRRFGTEDKLAADLNGRMLGLHASDTLSGIPAAHHWVIASSGEHPCAAGWRKQGFEITVNPDAREGLGTSVALAAQLAHNARADALLIALADMPYVTPEHFTALAELADPQVLAASHNGTANTPPAIFGREHFPALMQSSGDRGAGALLARAKIIPCPPEQLADIDLPSDLTSRHD